MKDFSPRRVSPAKSGHDIFFHHSQLFRHLGHLNTSPASGLQLSNCIDNFNDDVQTSSHIRLPTHIYSLQTQKRDSTVLSSLRDRLTHTE